MKKIFAFLICVIMCVSGMTACDTSGKNNDPSTDDEVPFNEYKKLVTKDEFNKQYEQAYKNLQPDYTKDFVYLYSNTFTEITENGEDRSTTNNRTEYDSDSQIVLFRYEFQNNDVDAPVNESYLWEYREKDGMLEFYDSRTSKTETRSLGFDEFWEFAQSRIPFALFPNPYKLFDNTTYYIDLDKDGNTVFFSTHVLEVAEKLCDRIGIINKGAIDEYQK